MTKIKDRIWLWGQNVQAHHAPDHGNPYKLPGENKMDSLDGCDFFDISKCCRVSMSNGPFPPFDDESEELKDLNEVVWSAIGAGTLTHYNTGYSDVDEILRQAKKYDNISGAVLDDFFKSVENFESSGEVARHSVESVKEIRHKLHNFEKRKLDLWLVWYEYQLDFEVQDYVDLCDVITSWTWNGTELVDLEKNMEKCLSKTPKKRHLSGCYMWNYGESMPLTIEQMKFQLDTYYNWMKSGVIEGIVLCSNCIADIGLETVDYTKQWLTEHGEENI